MLTDVENQLIIKYDKCQRYSRLKVIIKIMLLVALYLLGNLSTIKSF